MENTELAKAESVDTICSSLTMKLRHTHRVLPLVKKVSRKYPVHQDKDIMREVHLLWHKTVVSQYSTPLLRSRNQNAETKKLK